MQRQCLQIVGRLLPATLPERYSAELAKAPRGLSIGMPAFLLSVLAMSLSVQLRAKGGGEKGLITASLGVPLRGAIGVDIALLLITLLKKAPKVHSYKDPCCGFLK